MAATSSAPLHNGPEWLSQAVRPHRRLEFADVHKFRWFCQHAMVEIGCVDKAPNEKGVSGTQRDGITSGRDMQGQFPSVAALLERVLRGG